MKKVCVVGSGFVGSATGRGLRKHGVSVIFLDTSKDRVEELKREGLDARMPKEYTKIETDVTMFCVPTPSEGGKINLDMLRSAASKFAELLKGYAKRHTVVVRSTVPPGTTRNDIGQLIEEVSGNTAGRDFGLVMQPEYLREVSANDDFERPWVVAIGEYDKQSGDVVEELYEPFDVPIVRMTIEEAEAQKYVHNVFNAVKIAWFNEVRIVLRNEGMDADTIFQTTAQSCEGLWNPLYGTKDFGPFDGSCLPKDTRSFLEWGDRGAGDMPILRSVIKANLNHEEILGKNQHVSKNHLASIHV